MATLTRFEELEAWQKARQLVREIYRLTGEGEFARDLPLCDQIRRAAISVLSNIAEGFERESNAEFVQFLGIAKGSAGEVEAQLVVALDQGYVSQVQFDASREIIASAKRLIAGLIHYLRRSGMRTRTSRNP
jgi:four helix bundle protein